MREGGRAGIRVAVSARGGQPCRLSLEVGASGSPAGHNGGVFSAPYALKNHFPRY